MDTIVAIATPPGQSAIGVLRLSGPEAVSILRSLVQEEDFEPQPNQAILKTILADSGEVLDHAIVTYFKGPHSFSGEDLVEISCHGSPLILRELLDLVQRFDARLAGPGEFTLQACRNGKINLSQAEAIRDLISARSVAAAKQATRQLKGELSNALQSCKQILISVIVKLESALEFVEDDLPITERAEIEKQLNEVLASVTQLAGTYSSGHLLRDGLRVTLLGRPNVGKSSLFNRLLRLDRAIVTELPGTTRDSLTESISLKGIPLSLTDTAGLRVAGDKIEAIGVERTHRAIADADLLVVVIDGSSDLSAQDHEALAHVKEAAHVIALNKRDLGTSSLLERKLEAHPSVVHVSALTGEGLDELTAAILDPFTRVDSDGLGLLITDSRHYDLLRRTQASLLEGLESIRSGLSEELVLVGLKNALALLGEITGETTTDDILSEIFSTFCIGK